MAVTATFGETEYIEPNIIHIPMTFSQNICAIECSDFSITGIDALESLHVSGEGSEFSLHISPAIGLVGVMFVEIKGSVYLLGNDPERVISPIRSIRYDSREIYVTGKQLPPSILPGLQSAYFDLNREVVGVNPHAILISGVDVGQPKIYSAPTPDNDLISGLRPLDAEYLEYNNSDIPRRYFRLDFEFPEPPPIGTLNIDIKEGEVLGYVDPYVTPEIPDINLTFTSGLEFDQSYEISASEDATISVSGLPAGIMFQDTGNNILLIYGTPTTDGSGVAIISVNMEEVTSEVNWIVAPAQRRRTDDKRGSGPRQGTPVLSGNHATLIFGHDFDASATISGNPTNVYVEGLLRNWTYTYASGSLHVLGNAQDVTRIESGVWKVIMEYGNNQEIEATVNWNVEEFAPVITNPGSQTFYVDSPLDYEIIISNFPSVTVKGLLAKMYYDVSDNGVKLKGNPDRTVSLSEGRRIEISASNTGGTHTESFRFEISELSVAVVEASRDDIGIFDISGSNESEAVLNKYLNLPSGWINPRGITSLGNNKVAVVDASRDDIGIFDISGSNASEAVLDKYLSLPSGWSLPTGITSLSNNKVAVVDFLGDDIGIFDISGSNASEAVLDKYLNLPSGWSIATGITSLGNDKVVVNAPELSIIGIIDISGSNASDAVLDKYFNLTSLFPNPQGIAYLGSDKLVIAEGLNDDIIISDISGNTNTDLVLDKYLNLPSGWTIPTGITLL